MFTQSAMRGALLLGLRFLLIAPVCLVVWWLILPVYAWCLGQAVGMFVKYVGGLPVETMQIIRGGVLNTGSLVGFAVGEKTYSFPVAQLVSNVPTYIALILATPEMRVRRRLWAAGTGAGILVVGHGIYFVLAFFFRESIFRSPEMPEALAQLFLTLPFLLWAVFGYWDRLSALLPRANSTSE